MSFCAWNFHPFCAVGFCVCDCILDCSVWLFYLGDAFRYTLTPAYLHLETQFRCHIRQKRPDILYRLWFYLTIPTNGSIVETPKKSSEVLYSNAEDFIHGINEIDFVTVEHWAGAALARELILVGNNLNEDSINYTVETQSHLHRRRHHLSDIRPEWIQSNVFTFSTQFKDPFMYSTSTWVNSHNCDKDVHAFLPVSSSSADAEEEQRVNVVTRTAGSTSFQYAVVAPESDPHLRVSLCGRKKFSDAWLCHSVHECQCLFLFAFISRHCFHYEVKWSAIS